MKVSGSLPRSRARLVQLSVLVVILLALLYWRFGGKAETPLVASNSKAATAPVAPVQEPARSGPTAASGLPRPLNFGALEQVPVESAAARNPFKFYVPPPPPAPPPPPKSAAQLAAEQAAAQPRPVGPPPVPPITLKFIGKFQQGGKTIVMLTDGKAQFSAAEGGIIDGRFRIVKIGLESLQIEYVNGKGLTTLPFRG